MADPKKPTKAAGKKKAATPRKAKSKSKAPPVLGIDGNAVHEPMRTLNQEWEDGEAAESQGEAAGSPPAAKDTDGENAGDKATKPQKPSGKSSAPTELFVKPKDLETARRILEATQEGGELAGSTPPVEPADQGGNAGDDLVSSAAMDSPAAAEQSIPVVALACARLPGEGRAACWERLRKEARAIGMPRGQGSGTAYEWATRETDRLFPPPEPVIAEESPPEPEPEVVAEQPEQPEAAEQPSVAVAPAPIQVDQGVSGLNALPPGWPELPANAQLQVEIAWVTANRLRVRDGTGVNLAKALSPAPSYSALSWLETSILFPAKFADISVKATASQDDEREHIRREKLSIEEMRSILKEMLDAKGEST